MQCVACNDRGWVESQYHGISSCPLCKGRKSSNGGYDQDAIWLKLNDLSNVSLDRQLSDDLEKTNFGNIIAHFVFDRNVTPQGNLFEDTMRVSPTSKVTKLSNDQILSKGYALEPDGKVKTVNDIPVGPVYDRLMKWGGADGHSIWDMKEPIEVDPNRKGNPLFMDNNLMAIRVKFNDDAEKLIVQSAFITLKQSLIFSDVGKILNWRFT